MTIPLLRLFLFLLLISFPAGSLLAHEVRPGFLGLEEFSPGQFDVTWKQPVAYQRRLPLRPILPPTCVTMNEAVPVLSRASLVQHWRIDCGKEGILGAEIAIEGLPVTLIDVLVRVDLADGTMLNQVLRPDRPSFTLSSAGPLQLPTYLTLGFQHILSGFDHILFVVGLLLFTSRIRILAEIFAAFTVAHCLTLGLASLDLLRLSQKPVDAIIALSLLYLALELTRDPESEDTIVLTRPWAIVFPLGLIHGLAFAGGLREIGLPAHAGGWALVLFNLGIEVGQLTIITMGLLLKGIVRYGAPKLPSWIVRAPIYAMGMLSVYWVIARTAGIVAL